jgi:lipopolysaccharide export system protein LptC
VRFLRVAIPAVIVIIASVIVVATFFNPFRPLFPDWGGKIDLISPTKIRMESPRVHGFTTDQRPYELAARAAIQDLTSLAVVELNEIIAKVELRDGQRVNITSISGVYDTKAEVLRLNDHITISSTSGYEGRLSEATVHITSGNIVSDSVVEVRLPNGVLTANRLEIRENGAVIKFGGGVEMNLKPEQFRPAAQPATEDDPSAGTPAAPIQTSQRRGVVPP